MNLINIGIIVNTKGFKGEMKIINTPKNLFLPLNFPVFIGYSESLTEEYFLAEDFFGQIGSSTLFLKGIETKESAILLKEKGIFADKKEILKHNDNYIFNNEIIDCSVFDIDKNVIIGNIIDVLELPANNVWIVRTSDGDIPLPVIDDVIKECDFTNNIIKIKMLDGLEELTIKTK